MYLQYTPSSKRNLSSKIKDKSEAVYFFHVSKWWIWLLIFGGSGLSKYSVFVEIYIYLLKEN